MQLPVIIDGRPLVGNRTGIGVHTAEIASRLGVEPPPLIASHAAIENREGIEHCRFRVDRMSFGVLWQQLTLPRIARDGVLWAPHGTLPLALKIPAVSTIHDFTSMTMPGRHRIKTILSFNPLIGSSLQRATRIAAVSRAVAEEAMRWFGVPHSRIAIVPNGVDEYFSPAADPVDEDFILYAGTVEPRKGLDDLIAVWSSLPSPRPALVICGDPGWRVSLPPGVEAAGYVTRERLRDLYRRARVFVYPSRHEGFGIPPLEAMACGAPVIATRTGAIPEYAEGAALLVPPSDRPALRQAILRLLGSPSLRRELRAQGPERARHYRWASSAERMTELLAEAAR